ncbi:MAG: hypothetical protein AAB495_03415 [Patescibacteria group bacterium]
MDWRLLTSEERGIFSRLKNPEKVQDYLNNLVPKSKRDDEDYLSPQRVLQGAHANCFEGALLAAAAFWFHGGRPILLDLEPIRGDDAHVVALFKKHGAWGAVGKTNHAVLRYREPVYKTLRELALSYFHEYFLNNGRKTLRTYSFPFDLSKKKYSGWVVDKGDLGWIAADLEGSTHKDILPSKNMRMRLAEPIEIKAGKIVEWRSGRRVL